ncbi:MAG: RdgB/HAM1 family non-canonical purine NTP pyrophosphatase [Paracoccaceae bacterium]
MRKFDGKKLLIATHNAGKLAEFTRLLEPYGVQVVGAAEMDLPEPVEDGTTFVENARIKAHAAAKATGLPALSDDSGIEIDALNGAPGVYTADWAETGSGRDFKMAMTNTYEKIAATGRSAPWTARFCCTLVLAWPDGDDAVFAGVLDGQVVWPMRGVEGHGYDPIFMPNGHDVTLGEMSSDAKNAISHRADALAKFTAACFG